MNKTFLKYIIVAVVCLMSAFSASAGKIDVKARLDSMQLLMGRISRLRLEVVQDKGVKGEFPMFTSADPSVGIVPVCGDSVELRTSISRDTVDLGSGRIQINYNVPIQSFDSGYYHLPQFVYVAGKDTARSNSVTLKVVPVKVAATDSISGFTDVSDPDGKSIFDNVPDFLYYYWWVILLVIAGVVAAIYLYRKYHKTGTIAISRPKPKPLPYDVAIGALNRLKERKLWEKGMEKEYYTELTDILRVYLADRFGINAMEMTSRQIMTTLAYNPEIKDKRGYMRKILDMADFVKFAKVRPLPADNVASFDNAMSFVEATRPVAPAEGNQTGLADKKGGEK